MDLETTSHAHPSPTKNGCDLDSLSLLVALIKALITCAKCSVNSALFTSYKYLCQFKILLNIKNNIV